VAGKPVAFQRIRGERISTMDKRNELRTDTIAAVERAMPELNLIRQGSIREKTVRIWAEMFEESEWEALEDVPKNPETLPLSRRLIEHTRSVARQALAVAGIIEEAHGIKVDRDGLLAAALLHDVSKLLEYGPTGEGAGKTAAGKSFQHGFLGAVKALQHGMPRDVVHNIIVHTHSSRHMPVTVEAIIFHYVDYPDSDVLLLNEGRPLLGTSNLLRRAVSIGHSAAGCF